MSRTLVLIAGPSGSGKSHLARTGSAERPVVRLSLDDFYRDEDHPGMPQTLGIIDWDDVASWDLDAAMVAIRELLDGGRAAVPTYEISLNRSVGTHDVDASGARVVLAEGIFAAEVYRACLAEGLPVRAIWLDRPRGLNFARRLTRDLRERRKPPVLLVRRGVALLRSEARLREAAVECGFVPLSMRQARTLLTSMAVG